MKRDFKLWLSKMRTSIASYDYYVDFQKVYSLVDAHKIELNILNSLIGSKNIEQEFRDILIKYPETLKVIPALLAIRTNEIFIKETSKDYVFNFSKPNYSIDEYVKFSKETGILDLLENHVINNLYDYLMGVEVGLDSNGRKNRGGHLMEDLVENYIIEAGYVKNVNYFKEMYIKEIESRWDLDLSAISANDTSTKRFDYVIKTSTQIYVVETNFYASQGSKLNETARSYKMLAQECDKVKGLTFLWFTDGCGWKTAKKNLEETFDVLDTIYNIDDLDNGILKTLK